MPQTDAEGRENGSVVPCGWLKKRNKKQKGLMNMGLANLWDKRWFGMHPEIGLWYSEFPLDDPLNKSGTIHRGVNMNWPSRLFVSLVLRKRSAGFSEADLIKGKWELILFMRGVQEPPYVRLRGKGDVQLKMWVHLLGSAIRRNRPSFSGLRESTSKYSPKEIADIVLGEDENYGDPVVIDGIDFDVDPLSRTETAEQRTPKAGGSGRAREVRTTEGRYERKQGNTSRVQPPSFNSFAPQGRDPQMQYEGGQGYAEGGSNYRQQGQGDPWPPAHDNRPYNNHHFAPSGEPVGMQPHVRQQRNPGYFSHDLGAPMAGDYGGSRYDDGFPPEGGPGGSGFQGEYNGAMASGSAPPMGGPNGEYYGGAAPPGGHGNEYGNFGMQLESMPGPPMEGGSLSARGSGGFHEEYPQGPVGRSRSISSSPRYERDPSPDPSPPPPPRQKAAW